MSDSEKIEQEAKFQLQEQALPYATAGSEMAQANRTWFESIRVYPVPSTTSKVAGYVSCKVRTEMGYVYLNSMALVWGNNGLFLSFPSRKKENSPRGHEDYYFFERSMREKLQELAIQEYKIKGGNMVPPPPNAPEDPRGPVPPGLRGGGYGRPREDRWRQPMGTGYGHSGYGQPAYGGGYGQPGGYDGYNNGLRRPMGGYDSGPGANPRRPMQSGGGDYNNRRPPLRGIYGGGQGGYEPKPKPKPRFLPPQDELGDDSADFNTTQIKNRNE